MNSVIYNRPGTREDTDIRDEIQTVVDKDLFPVYPYISKIPKGSLVIGRYSTYPYFKDQHQELVSLGSEFINTPDMADYASDICLWYEDLKDWTPKTYSLWGNLGDGKWVVKGKRSSRKNQWDTCMYAEGRDQLLQVINRLLDDPMLAENGLVVREYVPLKRLGVGLNGMPISKEWRVFFAYGKLVCAGFYWSSYPDLEPDQIPSEAYGLALVAAQKIKDKINFVAVDVAETESGEFIVVEINDGLCSGLGMIHPLAFYVSLKDVLASV